MLRARNSWPRLNVGLRGISGRAKDHLDNRPYFTSAVANFMPVMVRNVVAFEPAHMTPCKSPYFLQVELVDEIADAGLGKVIAPG